LSEDKRIGTRRARAYGKQKATKEENRHVYRSPVAHHPSPLLSK
jgi:hypothetical protein